MTQLTTVSANHVASILSKLDSHKLSGSDGLYPHLLKHLTSVISQPDSKIFEFLILTRIILDDWRRLVETPIHNKRARTHIAYDDTKMVIKTTDFEIIHFDQLKTVE